MNKKFPFVSVVIPAYKAEKYIARAVHSVLEQEDVRVQIIVVEDGKFDNTEAALAQHMSKIEFISLKQNRGACHARNVGLARVKSDYVMFLDVDDCIEGPLLKNLFNALDCSGASVAFGTVVSKYENKDQVDFYYKSLKDENSMAVIRRWLAGKSGPGTCGIMWRKSEVARIGGWNESYSKNQDGEIVLRAMFKDCTVAYATEGTGVYWQHENERISSDISDSAFESLKALELYIENEFSKKGLNNRVYLHSLNVYRINTSRRAYLFNKDEYGKYFERKWMNAQFSWISFDFPGLKLGAKFKKYLIYNMFFRFFGIKKSDIIINHIKRKVDLSKKN